MTERACGALPLALTKDGEAMPEALLSAQSGLPAEVTSFVGRRSDRDRIRELMATSRMVTLTGFGGIGKTRLALRTATDLRRLFADGTYLVSLAVLSDSDGVPDHVAAALGLHGQGRQSATTAVLEYLAHRKALLVLDNCEHVIDMAAEIAEALIRTCPGVRVLATSREPLNIDGETVYPVPPLTIPTSDRSSQAPLAEYEAVQLFLERARALMPSFALTDENRDAVASICAKLEGIPLAIELATARLRALSPAELERQLSGQWELLSRGRRTAPARQSTMAGCIEWSFALCTGPERRLWAKASVFADGFDLEAAIAVCTEDDDEEPVAEILASLVEKSVVSAVEHGPRNRFRMVPPIRQRGLAELARMGDVEALRHRHKDFYLRLAEAAHDGWISGQQLEWLRNLRLENGNLREALEMCLKDPGDADAGLRAADHLMEFTLIEGLLRSIRHWLDQLLRTGAGNPENRARALRAGCWWATMQKDFDGAKEMLEQLRKLADEQVPTAATLVDEAAGLLALFSGDALGAEPLVRAARTSHAALGNDSAFVVSSMLLALDQTLTGDLEAADQTTQDLIELTHSAGESWTYSWAMWLAGVIAWAGGDMRQADKLMKDSLRLKGTLQDRLGIGSAIETLAWLAVEIDPQRTAVLIAAAENEWERIEQSLHSVVGLEERHATVLDRARELLGDTAFDTAWDQGRGLDQPSAIALALQERGRSPKPTAKQLGGHDVLTRRERQVAELVHQGLTNQEIADSLVISKRTAEAHVEHILLKLGFSSRAMIAAWVAELHARTDS